MTLETYQELVIETYVEEINPEECGCHTKCSTENDETLYKTYTNGIPKI